MEKKIIAKQGNRVLIQINDSNKGYIYDRKLKKVYPVQLINSILAMSGGEWDVVKSSVNKSPMSY